MAETTTERKAIDPATATRLVCDYVAPNLRVTEIRDVHQGVYHRITEWLTTGTPRSIIAKVHQEPEDAGLRREFAMLAWYKQHTKVPVPQPYACVYGSPAYRGTVLLMERMNGPSMQNARISTKGWQQFQIDLAHHLINLHDHKRQTYGSALEPENFKRWLDTFAPNFEYAISRVQDQLSPRTRAVVLQIARELERWLPEFGQPTLVHGDLWAQNILVDDRRADQPFIIALIDGGVYFYDVEFELAHLRLFETVDETFFRHYQRRHPLRPGFDRRCQVYWLHTLLLHVEYYGREYLPRCEQLIQQIEATM